jgi:hypothetical protein
VSIRKNPESENKTTLRFHLPFIVRMAIIKKSNNSKCGGKGTFTGCWWECKLVQPLWKSLKKLKRWNYQRSC